MENEIFFKQLRGHLRGLTQAEQDDVIDFYREYASDANLAGERLIKAFGTPKQLARRVLVDYSIRYDDMVDNDAPSTDETPRIQQTKRVKRQMNLLWVILLALLTSWVWIPAVLLILVGLFIFVMLVIFVILGLVFAAIAGILLLWAGVGLMAQSLVSGVFWLGAGLVLIGIQFVAWPIGLLILKVALDGLITFAKFLGRRFSKGTERGGSTHA